MKNILTAVIFFLSFNAVAGSYKHTDTINELGAAVFADEYDYVTLNGFTQAGSCQTSSGLIVARFPYGESGQRAFSIALSAKMSGKKIMLSVDDANKHPIHGCFVKSISISE